MVSSSLRRVLLIGLFVGLCPEVWADAILVGDARFISGHVVAVDSAVIGVPGSVEDTFGHVPASLGMPFLISDLIAATAGSGSSTASAVQNSTVGPLLFTAEGSASAVATADSALFDYAFGDGRSQYNVSFELTEPHTYDFDALINAGFVGTSGVSRITAWLWSPTLSYIHFSQIFSNGSDSLHFTGTLFPDTYQLLFDARVRSSAGLLFTMNSENASAGFAGSLALAPIDGAPPIPEPTTIVLVTSGLVGMGVRKWRKRRVKG